MKKTIKFGIADKPNIEGGKNRVDRWNFLIREAESIKPRLLAFEEAILIDDDWDEYVDDRRKMLERYRKLMVSICRKDGHYIIDLSIIAERNIKALKTRLDIAWEESFDGEFTDEENEDLRRMLARYNCMVDQFSAFKNAMREAIG